MEAGCTAKHAGEKTKEVPHTPEIEIEGLNHLMLRDQLINHSAIHSSFGLLC